MAENHLRDALMRRLRDENPRCKSMSDSRRDLAQRLREQTIALPEHGLSVAIGAYAIGDARTLVLRAERDDGKLPTYVEIVQALKPAGVALGSVIDADKPDGRTSGPLVLIFSRSFDLDGEVERWEHRDDPPRPALPKPGPATHHGELPDGPETTPESAPTA